MSQRFCVMTVGRTGSTWLMEALAEFPDVAVPAKNVDSPDNELLMPGMPPKYQKLTGCQMKSADDLIEAFFAYNAASKFAGFKSMPNRHTNYRQFVQRSDIRFITLDRRDVASMTASFLMARTKGTWRRSGGTPQESIVFTPEISALTAQNLQFVMRSKMMLGSIKPAIRLFYEDLCEPGFQSAELDAFFGRAVRLPAPKPATRAEDYIENGQEYQGFVQRTWQEMLAALPAEARKLL